MLKNKYELIKFNLTILADHAKNNKETFKARAYTKALNSLPKDIYKLEDLRGIGGKGIQEKFVILFETDTNLTQVEEIINDPVNILISKLSEIHGIGSIKAKKLVKENNINSFDDLKKNQHLLNDVQKKGLFYHEDIQKRIPYSEMKLHDEFIMNIFSQIKEHDNSLSDVHYKLTGSFRRIESSSGDIDVIFSGKKNVIGYLVSCLLQMNYLQKDGIFSNGKIKFMGMCKLPNKKHFRRIDLMYSPPHEFPFALLYFTGSFQFNIDMRAYAASLGYVLNEHGLFDKESNQSILTANTEADIFSFLNHDYIEPKKRLHFNK
jgi:DNA polymerase/3'-5' exonuclease PolX|tara:strand:+ start:24150 stop:25109 length:960 start_codon:yes stop_codon:yes gene_type:complete